MDKTELAEYIGRNDGYDEITLQPLRGLAATLDHPHSDWRAGDPLPPGWQWLYFLPLTPQSKLDKDGHARRDASIPPSARRMFAGGRMSFHRPLHVGEKIFRESSIVDIKEKQGRTGRLVFTTIQYSYHDTAGIALEEQQDLVFRETGSVPLPERETAEIPSAQWQNCVTPDPVMLFRFSALTFNGHRIHYDLPYTQKEGYPGLIVHGPLIAILLLDLAACNLEKRYATSFSFRAQAPVYADTPIALRGELNNDGTASLRAFRNDGIVAMTAGLRFSDDGSGIPLSSV